MRWSIWFVIVMSVSGGVSGAEMYHPLGGRSAVRPPETAEALGGRGLIIVPAVPLRQPEFVNPQNAPMPAPVGQGTSTAFDNYIGPMKDSVLRDSPRVSEVICVHNGLLECGVEVVGQAGGLARQKYQGNKPNFAGALAEAQRSCMQAVELDCDYNSQKSQLDYCFRKPFEAGNYGYECKALQERARANYDRFGSAYSPSSVPLQCDVQRDGIVSCRPILPREFYAGQTGASGPPRLACEVIVTDKPRLYCGLVNKSETEALPSLAPGTTGTVYRVRAGQLVCRPIEVQADGKISGLPWKDAPQPGVILSPPPSSQEEPKLVLPDWTKLVAPQSKPGQCPVERTQ